jgi:hypothetical protein
MPAALISRITFSTSRTISGARPSVGSSSSSTLDVLDERARDREHLLLAAADLVALVGEPLAQARELLVDVVERPARFARGDLRELEVLRDGQVGEDAPLLGDQRDPHARDRHHVAAGELLAVERDAAGARRNPADDALERRRLADAVAAQQRDGLAGADVQRDVAQDVAVAVVGVDVLVERERASSVAAAVIAARARYGAPLRCGRRGTLPARAGWRGSRPAFRSRRRGLGGAR